MTLRHNELDLDHHFFNAVRDNLAFRHWFLGHSKFAGQTMELVTSEKWHQRWYTNPDTGVQSESDIVLFFERPNGERLAIHIENKPAHGKWQIDQPLHYRPRAENRMKRWRHVDWEVGLIAPSSFLMRCADDVAHFDFAVSYEDIEKFVPQFGWPDATKDPV